MRYGEPRTIRRGVLSLIGRYMRWLHTGWPAGTVEKLPEVNEDGTTAVPGLRVVGDLTGIPLLKFSVDTGAKAVQAVLKEPDFNRGDAGDDVLDLAIIGGGLSGIAAAIEAKKAGLNFKVFEASKTFSTIKDFPKGKPIFTYPTEMTPAGDLQMSADVKEDLVAELESQREANGIDPVIVRIERVARSGGLLVLHGKDLEIRARRVIVAIGRSGNFRKLGVPGEDKPKVFNRLHDPKEFAGRHVLVVGGGDSAIEASIALALAGAKVTHSYRRDTFSRPKPENVEKLNQLVSDPMADVAVEEPTSERVTTSFTPAMCARTGEGSICLALPSQVVEIRDNEVDLKGNGGQVDILPNDVVFSMIGREPPLDFFRRAGVPIRGEWGSRQYVGFSLFMLFCIFLYHWKSGAKILPINAWFQAKNWFPFNVGGWFDSFAAAASIPSNFLYTLKLSMSSPSFYYTLAYCLCVVIFGIRRIRRRKTPYVKLQTYTLMAIQCLPLFILPELILPWAGRNGWFEHGTRAGSIADQFFEPSDVPTQAQWEAAGFSSLEEWDRPIGRERQYWRAYGFVLAWPLFVWNFFTEAPLWGWLIIGSLQTFVLIPLLIRRWGKGAYCGWICSCGALAETLGDAHRQKMLHGPFWNRMNMVGQVILLFAFVLFILRIGSWVWPDSFFSDVFEALVGGIPIINYKWSVDLMLAGVLGVGCYFWFSGRVWCRFACPLAALMHIYARFSKFRIFAEKAKCISCNVCTSVCHQGIDIMNFANKGVPMEDPECVRCSACVQSCPTGVLSFGRYGPRGEIIHDRLAASMVRVEEVGLPK
ncbi:MAG: NAD(P)-binding domain-containing protein [Phycisphaerales bacterium]|nr:NAD(P)-binding domain-containing protein [Phycisphaerales bacterium]